MPGAGYYWEPCRYGSADTKFSSQVSKFVIWAFIACWKPHASHGNMKISFNFIKLYKLLYTKYATTLFSRRVQSGWQLYWTVCASVGSVNNKIASDS
jgi:predicted membrane protein